MISPNWLNFDVVKYPNAPKIICGSIKKPLNDFSLSHFHQILHGTLLKGDREFVEMDTLHCPSWLPIYGRNHLKIFFSRTKKALKLNIGIKH